MAGHQPASRWHIAVESCESAATLAVIRAGALQCSLGDSMSSLDMSSHRIVKYKSGSEGNVDGLVA